LAGTRYFGCRMCLPPEILRKIFGLLSPKNLKKVMLVSKMWKGQAEDPGLWTWSVVTVIRRADLQKLYIHRLQLVENIRLRPSYHPKSFWYHPEDLSFLFQALLAFPSIKKIVSIETYDLTQLEPGLLAGVLGKLDVVKLPSARSYLRRIFSKAQLEHIFTAIAERETPVKFLDLSGLDVTNLSRNIFVSALSNVRELELNSVEGHLHMQDFLKEIVEHELPLVKLKLQTSIGDIDPDLVGKAFNRLEEVQVEMHRYVMIVLQIKATLRGVVMGESKLKRLMLNNLHILDYMNLDEELVRQAAQKIGNFFKLSKYE